MSAPTQENRQISVQTPLGEDVLLLTSFSGHEEISRLFAYRLEMLSERDSIEPREIVGKGVTFQVRRADGESFRYFHGVVSRFSAGGRSGGLRQYSAEVVPWLWFLTRTANCRIFQNKSVPQIIEQIFQDLGFSDYETSEIQGSHEPWEYCAQFRETAFNFLSRLMEQEGIFYFFRHEEGKHTLVLADQKAAHRDLPENEVEYQYSYGGQSAADQLTSWTHQYEFTPGKWSQTDYNFIDHPARNEPTPANLMMSNEQTTVSLDNIDRYEIYDYPGEFDSTDEGRTCTKLRMEEDEVAHDVVASSSTCKTFSAGGKFRVSRHDCRSEEGKRFVITAIDHHASEPSQYGGAAGAGPDYANRFKCIPDTVTFRPARTTPKPVVQGCQTAVVVGPPGEEIWPDKYGRVKVQFFWDREGRSDENSSCWVRVSQIYAGKQWGSMAIPRIGQEVIVSYLDGDPDRPIITGRVYNADQMPPFALPGSKAVSGMKSNSTPGGGGYNELSLDDTKGKEKIVVHGQYDMETTVEHDQTTKIHNDRSTTIDGNDTEKVGGNQTVQVGKNQTTKVGANQSTKVGSNQMTKVGGSQIIKVSGSRQVTVGGSTTIKSGSTIKLSAGGSTIEIGPAGVKITSAGVIRIQGNLVKIN